MSEHLVCPVERAALEAVGASLVCTRCGRPYPIDDDGIVSFLDEEPPGARGWDTQSEAYADSFSAFTDAVEIAATVGRVRARPGLPVLDHGAGTGRMTAALHDHTGEDVVAVDYSRENLRRLVAGCTGRPVRAVHADGRRLPLADHSVGAVCSAGMYALLEGTARQEVLRELARVMAPGATLVLSTLNYGLLFRLWRLRGNAGAREGRRLHDEDIYYRRLTAGELRRELAPCFTVEQLCGIRNIPGRTVVSAAGRVGGRRGAAAAAWSLEHAGRRVDRQLERLPLSRLTGFLLIARAHPAVAVRTAASPAAALPSTRV
jgi:SAM-dependent methyltransferase